MMIVLLSIAAIGSSVATAVTTASCADQVIADWYDDGRVGRIYPLQCYTQAIKKLPPDVRDYSNAKEEITRALAFAKQGKPDPGGNDPTPPTGTTTNGGTGTTTTTAKPPVTTGTGTTPTTPTPTDTGGPTETTYTGTTDTSGPSSVPIPLLVLGGLAVLLLAAGSAGYLRRRINRGGDGGTMPPPAA